ncbi:MAG: FAD-dependent oxidoreductase [Alphaproteobacteria bacterium]
MTTLDVQCAIAGGGPAGMMAGLLLARAGVRVAVLEKHSDFLRDFRGDTIHPSTLELMAELGELDAFLALPHQKAHGLAAQVGARHFRIADFSHLPVRCPYIAFMPQWDFLDFLAGIAARYPTFALHRRAEVTGLIEADGRVAGLRAATPDGDLAVRADLVIGADGRHSAVRAAAGLAVQAVGAPMDVLWFRLSRRPDDPDETMGRFDAGSICVLIDRGDYWQCGFVIPKGAIDAIRAQGLPAFRERLARLVPFLAGRLDELADWRALSLLTVTVDRLTSWHRPGLLCIGDAAHAMSPVGGVGINLAIQDAVAAANILAAPLRDGRATRGHLAAVQARRTFPVRVTQAMQVAVQKRVISRVLRADAALTPPFFLRLLDAVPPLRRLPARLVGMGIRPEHIGTPDAFAG